MIFLMDLQVKQIQSAAETACRETDDFALASHGPGLAGSSPDPAGQLGTVARGPGPSSGRRRAMFAHGSSSVGTEGCVQVRVRVPGTLTPSRRSTAVGRGGKEAPVPAAGPPGR